MARILDSQPNENFFTILTPSGPVRMYVDDLLSIIDVGRFVDLSEDDPRKEKIINAIKNICTAIVSFQSKDEITVEELVDTGIVTINNLINHPDLYKKYILKTIDVDFPLKIEHSVERLLDGESSPRLVDVISLDGSVVPGIQILDLHDEYEVLVATIKIDDDEFVIRVPKTPTELIDRLYDYVENRSLNKEKDSYVKDIAVIDDELKIIKVTENESRICGPTIEAGNIEYDDWANAGDKLTNRVVKGSNSLSYLTYRFFEQYLGNIDNSIIYFGNCSSGRDRDIVNVLLDKGAKAVIASSDDIQEAYGNVFTYYFSEALSLGKTIAQSISYAKSICGNTDRDKFGDSTKGAYMIAYGDSEFRLSEGSYTVVTVQPNYDEELLKPSDSRLPCPDDCNLAEVITKALEKLCGNEFVDYEALFKNEIISSDLLSNASNHQIIIFQGHGEYFYTEEQAVNMPSVSDKDAEATTQYIGANSASPGVVKAGYGVKSKDGVFSVHEILGGTIAPTADMGKVGDIYVLYSS